MNLRAIPMVAMGDLVDKVGAAVDVNPSESYHQIGIRSHGKGLFYKEAVTGLVLGAKRVFWVEPDCLVINIVFAWEQAVARTTEADRGKIASHRFPMYRPKAGLADVDYLTYLFKTKLGKHLLTLASPGGAGRNKTLGQAEFMRIEIPCPSLPEQKTIAAILAVSDAAIATTKSLIRNSQAQKKALMQQLLTGNKRLPGFTEKWDSFKLRELTEIIYGASPKGIEDENGTNPIIGTGGVVGFTNQSTYDQPSIVIGRKGTIDRPQLVTGPFWAIDTTYYCKPRSRCDLHWLYHSFNDINFQKHNESSGVPSLARETLYSISLNVPSIPEQRAIAAVLNTADADISIWERELIRLTSERTALLQQLLTGKRRVHVISSAKERARA